MTFTATLPPKPVVAPPNLAGIPKELMYLSQWGMWRYDLRDGKYTKTPYGKRGKDGRPAKAHADKLRTWLPFTVAASWFKRYGFDGVGFLFLADGPYAGIDLDKCRNPETGEILPNAKALIERFASYTEVSPSKTGVKIVVRGRLNLPPKPNGKPNSGRRNNKFEWAPGQFGAIECYDSYRYFTITGDVIPGFEKINDCPDLRTWFDETMPKEREKPARVKKGTPASESREHDAVASLSIPDMERIASRATNGAKFRRLYFDGDITGYDSHSEAVMALCTLLAFYLRDAATIKEAFNRSKLCNDKWGSRDDILDETIDKAIGGCREFYTPGKRRGDDDPDLPKPIANYEEIEAEGEADAEGGEGEKQTITIPLSMEEIQLRIHKRTEDTIARVGPALFVEGQRGRIDFLKTPAAVFGYCGTKGAYPPAWCRGGKFHSKEEAFSELSRTARPYVGVSTFPHEPRIPDYYYACDFPEPGDGSTLEALLDWYNPATPVDRDLIKAMLATLMWGGRPGARPAFAITSKDGRGVGKTSVFDTAASIFGGALWFDSSEKVREIKERLLSPEGQVRRAAGLDNLKSHKFSCAAIESLITATSISGRAMFIGEAQIPNRLTWLITVNGMSLSTDMAQRTVEIEVARPKYNGAWEDDIRSFIETNRQRIIADLIAFLRSKPQQLDAHSRFGLWEMEILSRLPDPIEARKVIAERRQVADVEQEETQVIEDFAQDQLENLHFDTDHDRIFIPTLLMTRWVNAATGENHSTTAVGRMIGQRIDEKKLKRIRICPHRNNGRGYEWTGANWNPVNAVKTDIESRLSYARDGSNYDR